MLAILENQGNNPATKTSTLAPLPLTETVNGHSASFTPAGVPFIVGEDSEELPKTPNWPKKLANRRGGFNQVLKMSDGMKLYLRTGEYPDGTLGEIFVDTQKEGTFARSMLNCFAVAISTGLQHGVPLSVFVEQFKNVMFEPKGPILGSEVMEEATSIIDAIFIELEASYPTGKAMKPAHVRGITLES